MLNWMKYWLAGDSQPVGDLAEENPIPEADLMCYPLGERPEACGYGTVRKLIADTVESQVSVGDERQARADLAQLIGWKAPVYPAVWTLKRTLEEGTQIGTIVSPRALPLPIVTSGEVKKDAQEIRLLLSPEGKTSPFVIEQWEKAIQAGVLAVTVDLPAVGELAWEPVVAGENWFHDSTRAALWLGYTLVGEWAEAVAAICRALRGKPPSARLHVVAERETVFAVLLAQALLPDENLELLEFDCPRSLRGAIPPSLTWCVPDFLRWGDLNRLRTLAGMEPRKP